MPLITTATARSLAALSVEARRRYAAERAAQPNPEPPPVQPVPLSEDSSYTHTSKLRVRKQIQRCNERLEDALDARVLDAGAIDRLANALTRLRELERVLDGRPLPGSKRPSSKPDKVKPSFEPASE